MFKYIIALVLAIAVGWCGHPTLASKQESHDYIGEHRGSSLPADATASPLPKPNILVLLIDDMGWSDLGCFGSPNNTSPEIDSLVGRGLRFTQWVSGSSICTPSRASIQTGRYA